MRAKPMYPAGCCLSTFDPSCLLPARSNRPPHLKCECLHILCLANIGPVAQIGSDMLYTALLLCLVVLAGGSPALAAGLAVLAGFLAALHQGVTASVCPTLPSVIMENNQGNHKTILFSKVKFQLSVCGRGHRTRHPPDYFCCCFPGSTCNCDRTLDLD